MRMPLIKGYFNEASDRYYLIKREQNLPIKKRNRHHRKEKANTGVLMPIVELQLEINAHNCTSNKALLFPQHKSYIYKEL